MSDYGCSTVRTYFLLCYKNIDYQIEMGNSAYDHFEVFSVFSNNFTHKVRISNGTTDQRTEQYILTRELICKEEKARKEANRYRGIIYI